MFEDCPTLLFLKAEVLGRMPDDFMINLSAPESLVSAVEDSMSKE
jgi:hypothetical protein